MKNKFLIGKVAKLYNISKQALIYYDKINLLKPINSEENNYRYYTYNELETLDVILCLKETGMPLKKIKKFLDNRNLDETIKILENQTEIISQRIKKLNKINNKMTKRLENLIEFKKSYDGKFEIKKKYFKKRKILKVPVIYNIKKSIDIAIGEAYKELNEYLLSRNELNRYSHLSYSVGFSKKNILEGKYEKVSFAFVEIKEDLKFNKFLEEIEESEYICSLHFGTYDDSKHTYEKLLNYIEVNDYIIVGDIIEIPKIDAWSVKEEMDYITEIQIPVKKL